MTRRESMQERERREAREAAEQERAEKIRATIFGTIEIVKYVTEEVRGQLKGALEDRVQALRAKGLTHDRGRLEVMMVGWSAPIILRVFNPIEEEIGQILGYEVVERGSGRREWRYRNWADGIVGQWQRWVLAQRGLYDLAMENINGFAADPNDLIFDDGHLVEVATRRAFVLKWAQTIDEEIAAAVAANDDLRVRAALAALHASCQEFFMRVRWNRKSTSEISRWNAMMEGVAVAEVIDRCQATLGAMQ
jgi:hypothetical protein